MLVMCEHMLALPLHWLYMTKLVVDQTSKLFYLTKLQANIKEQNILINKQFQGV